MKQVQVCLHLEPKSFCRLFKLFCSQRIQKKQEKNIRMLVLIYFCVSKSFVSTPFISHTLSLLSLPSLPLSLSSLPKFPPASLTHPLRDANKVINPKNRKRKKQKKVAATHFFMANSFYGTVCIQKDSTWLCSLKRTNEHLLH